MQRKYGNDAQVLSYLQKCVVLIFITKKIFFTLIIKYKSKTVNNHKQMWVVPLKLLKNKIDTSTFYKAQVYSNKDSLRWVDDYLRYFVAYKHVCIYVASFQF